MGGNEKHKGVVVVGGDEGGGGAAQFDSIAPGPQPSALVPRLSLSSLPLSPRPLPHAVAVGGPYRSRSNVSVWDDPVAGSRVTPTSASAWW